jgi:hypothetical protein
VCVYTMYIYLKQWDGVVQPADISIITGLLCGDIFLPPLPRGGCMGGGGLSPLIERILYMEGVLRREKGVNSLQGERELIPSSVRQAGTGQSAILFRRPAEEEDFLLFVA